MIGVMNIRRYIRNIGGSTVLLEKAKKVRKIADFICPDKIIDFHISEYKKKTGERVFQSLFLFSERFQLESKNIMSADVNMDITFHKSFIDYYEITSSAYDFSKSATDESTLKIEGAMGNMSFELKATGRNCENLWDILTKYIKPNMYIGSKTEEE